MMWEDPIVEETRRMKNEYASKFNYDLQAIYHDLKELEKQLPENRLIPTQPMIETTVQTHNTHESRAKHV